jgi:hypothetical protein
LYRSSLTLESTHFVVKRYSIYEIHDGKLHLYADLQKAHYSRQTEGARNNSSRLMALPNRYSKEQRGGRYTKGVQSIVD